MTSSLPNFAPAPAPAGAASPSSPGLTGFGATAAPASSGDFADLMSEQDAAADCPEMATAMPRFTILAPTLISLLSAPAEPSAEVAALPATAAADEAAPPGGGITRDIMEQAASLFATILQSMLPEAAAPVVPTGVANTAPTGAARSDAGLPLGGTLAGARPGVPGATGSAEFAGTAPASEIATAPSTTATAIPATGNGTPTAATEKPAAASAQFEVSLAADGAVEIKAELPKEQGSARQTGASGAGAFEIEAEIALPGQAVMRLSAATPAGHELSAKAKFAGKISAGGSALGSPNGGVEINFLSSDNKQLKSDFAESGIAVAKPGLTMNTPTEATRATSSSDALADFSARGQFTVAWPSAERAQGPVAVSVENNFAERAVATVSNLVDTQFTASMQKSGSVQLRLKFGGEDLSVRVELRGGAVHTDFRTDSPELRAALNREWQAVAGQSSHSLRSFVDPVFSPSSSSGDDAYAPRQQAAQQDLSQQSRNPRAREEESSASPFARRSLVGDIFSPQPAAPRAPAYVSTSLRLSVLA